MKRAVLLSALLITVSVYFACKKSDSTVTAGVTLNTTAVSNLTDSSVVTGGDIISVGMDKIITRGICWGTSPDPTTSNSTSVDSNTTTGQYVSITTGLAGGTTYYARSFVTTSAGTFYGNEITFTTKVRQLANEVYIQGFAFNPKTLTVPVNTTVKWTNQDATLHTVTSDTQLFDSGNLANGAWFSYMFTTPGTYTYHCSFHTYMTGTIVVQ